MSASRLLTDFGLKPAERLPVTGRIPSEQIAALDQIAADAGVSRSRLAAALLQDGIRRYAAAA